MRALSIAAMGFLIFGSVHCDLWNEITDTFIPPTFFSSVARAMNYTEILFLVEKDSLSNHSKYHGRFLCQK